MNSEYRANIPGTKLELVLDVINNRLSIQDGVVEHYPLALGSKSFFETSFKGTQFGYFKKRLSNIDQYLTEDQLEDAWNSLQLQKEPETDKKVQQLAPIEDADITIEKGWKQADKGTISTLLQLSNGMPRKIVHFQSDSEEGASGVLSSNVLADIKLLDITLYEPLYPEYESQHSLFDIKFEANGATYEYSKIGLTKYLNKLNSVHYLRITAGSEMLELGELIMKFAVTNGRRGISPGLPGIFYKAGKFYLEDIDFPTADKLECAIKTLVELEQDIQPELQPMFRNLVLWTLGAAFNWSRKVKGGAPNFYPSLIAYGLGQTSKTTLMTLAQCIWRNYNDIKAGFITGRGGFDSDARMRNAINKTTFPVIVEELPNNGADAMDYLKNISNTLTSVIMDNDGVTPKEFLNLSLAYISTNNTPVLTDSGQGRRILLIDFDSITKPIPDDVALTFSNKWLTGDKLNKLTEIGKAAAQFVIDNPDVISLGFVDIGTTILNGVTGLDWKYTEEFNTSVTTETAKDTKRDEIFDFLYKNVSRWADEKVYGAENGFDDFTEEQIEQLLLKVLPSQTNYINLVSNKTEYAIKPPVIRRYLDNQNNENTIDEGAIREALGLNKKNVKVIGSKSKTRKYIINIYKFAEFVGIFEGYSEEQLDYWKKLFKYYEVV